MEKNLAIGAGIIAAIFFFLFILYLKKAKGLLGDNKNLEDENEKFKAENFKQKKRLEALLKESKEKVMQFSTLMMSLNNLAKAIGSTLVLEEVLDSIVKVAEGMLGATRFSIFLTNEKKTKLTFAAGLGWNDQEIEQEKKNRIPMTEENLLGYVAKTGRTLNNAAITRDFTLAGLAKKSRIKTLIAAPLVSNKEVVGVLNVEKLSVAKAKKGETKEDKKLMIILTSLAAMAIKNGAMFKKIDNFAKMDALTNMFNVRYFRDTLDEEMAKVDKDGGVVSMIMSDIDHFKPFNDTYGHQIGDFVLAATAQRMMEAAEDFDERIICCRYGGEEFTAILPGVDENVAYQFSEKYRKHVEQQTYHEEGHTLNVTISVGIACYPNQAKERELLILSCDNALYECKEGGRNCSRIGKKTDSTTTSH